MPANVGEAAPNFKLPSITGEAQGEFDLSAYKGKKVVICFYALDFSPVCQDQISVMQASLPRFAEANAEVVGVATDSIFAHRAFQKSLGGLSFPLASDRWPYAETAKSYGIFPASKHQFGGTNDRAVFVVDQHGKVRWAKVYELGELPDVGEILRAVQNIP
jgi:peroxiredoxin